jgi:hypothetical protein
MITALGFLSTTPSRKKFLLHISDSHTVYLQLVAIPNCNLDMVINTVFKQFFCLARFPERIAFPWDPEHCLKLNNELAWRFNNRGTQVNLPYCHLGK